MTVSFQTADLITETASRAFLADCKFLNKINRQFDDSYSASGAANGSTLRLRTPPKFVVATGATLTEGNYTDQSVTLTKATHYHVPLPYLTSAELSQSKKMTTFLKDVAIASRILCHRVESDMLGIAYKGAGRTAGTIGSDVTFATVAQARELLGEQMVPDVDRCLQLNPTMARTFVADTKGLMHSASAIEQQYKKGLIGMTSGFDVYENTLLPRHTSGGNAGTGYLVNDTYANGETTITVDTGTGTLVAGDTITFASVYEVHPTTRVTSTRLFRNVVAANYAGGAGTVSLVYPMYDGSGATSHLQNVSALPADNAAITKDGTASQAYSVGLAHGTDFFAFATTDMVLPDGVHMMSRKNIDGISIRFVQDWDNVNGKFTTRLDLLCGGVVYRPEAACRIVT
jgi:hypothetical protein